jgi:hypothetical protein
MKGPVRVAIVASLLLGEAAQVNAAAPPLERVSSRDLCTTLGKPAPAPDGFSIDEPKWRATIPGSLGRRASLRFRFQGPSRETARLRSGQKRAQLGLKLLSPDTCNVLYVMWRHGEKAAIEVSLKRNPGQTTHAECQNRGYSRLAPDHTAKVAALEPGAVHRLAAELEGNSLVVRVDEAVVWRGRLDPSLLPLAGQAGVRSDNLRFDVLELQADLAPNLAPAPCHAARANEPAD